MNFFSVEDEEKLRNNKSIVKKRMGKANSKKRISQEKENDKFSFENEIVIGVTKKESPKSGNKNNKKDKKKIKKVNKKQSKNIKIKKNNTRAKKTQTVEDFDYQKFKKKMRLKKASKYFAIVLLILAVIIIAMFSPIFNIKIINVQGNKKLTQNEIVSLSQVEQGENLFKISKSKISEQIKENAYVSEVKITRNLPSTINIQIEEREALYQIEYANGYIYIDKQGFMLEISEEKQSLPILQGISTESTNFEVGNRLNKEDLNKLAVVYKIVEAAEANEISNLITRIDIENIQNLKLSFESKSKVAHLGDSSNLVDKIIRIKMILEQEEGNSGEIFVNMDLNKENPIFRQSV